MLPVYSPNSIRNAPRLAGVLPGAVRWTDVACVGLVAWLLLALNSVACGQDLGREALSKKNYPWYDAERDQIKRIELGDRPAVRSKNRDDVKLAPPTKAPATGNWNWGGADSFFEGLGILVWILIGLVIAMVAGLLVWAFLRIGTNQTIRNDGIKRRTMEESIKQLPFGLETAAISDFRLAAERAHRAKDYRQAIIYLFSEVLVSLDQKGLIRLRKGKTNRQYLAELRPYGSMASYYQRVMVPFEATFFGEHQLEKEDFEACWNDLGKFQSDIEQTSQVGHV